MTPTPRTSGLQITLMSFCLVFSSPSLLLGLAFFDVPSKILGIFIMFNENYIEHKPHIRKSMINADLYRHFIWFLEIYFTLSWFCTLLCLQHHVLYVGQIRLQPIYKKMEVTHHQIFLPKLPVVLHILPRLSTRGFSASRCCSAPVRDSTRTPEISMGKKRISPEGFWARSHPQHTISVVVADGKVFKTSSWWSVFSDKRCSKCFLNVWSAHLRPTNKRQTCCIGGRSKYVHT